MTKSKILVRLYNFTDAWLIQLADSLLILIVRDAGQLLKRGVTELKKDTLQTLRDQFSETKPDDYYMALAAIETENKDAARDTLSNALRTIFVAAENVYEAGTAHYNAFGNPALTRLTDEEMIRNGRQALGTARKFLSKLEDEGITEVSLDSTEALIDDFDRAIDVQREAQQARDLATEDRITKGNALYKLIVKICNSGKDAWAPINESKYNDYVIYNTPSGKAETTGMGRIRGIITNAAGEELEGVQCEVVGTNLVVESDEYGEYEIDNVPVGDRSMEFSLETYKTYFDEIVAVFENQETKNDIEMETDETPTPAET